MAIIGFNGNAITIGPAVGGIIVCVAMQMKIQQLILHVLDSDEIYPIN
jgi:hypothetical protein